MHTHLETRNDLAVYLATGVTTVLHMGSARAGFIGTIVPAVNRGAIPGPHVYTSFLVDGSTDDDGFVIKTPAEASAIVGLARPTGTTSSKSTSVSRRTYFLRSPLKGAASACL